MYIYNKYVYMNMYIHTIQKVSRQITCSLLTTRKTFRVKITYPTVWSWIILVNESGFQCLLICVYCGRIGDLQLCETVPRASTGLFMALWVLVCIYSKNCKKWYIMGSAKWKFDFRISDKDGASRAHWYLISCTLLRSSFGQEFHDLRNDFVVIRG